MKEGAFDFIQKPVDLEHLKVLVQRAARQQELLRENLLLREEFSARYGFRASSENTPLSVISVHRFSASHKPIPLSAASAKRYRQRTFRPRRPSFFRPRRDLPFVALNCAAIPEGLVENELFGHERGAFTAQAIVKAGKMDLAHRGTLFLDEIGELPLAIQAKLLRVLEERNFERVGGTQIHRRGRAQSSSYQSRPAQSRCRQILPRRSLLSHLRCSADDSAAPRARYTTCCSSPSTSLEKFSREFGKPGARLSDDAKQRILDYRWPGNVREHPERHRTRRDSFRRPASFPPTRCSCSRSALNQIRCPPECYPQRFPGKERWRKWSGAPCNPPRRVLLENTMRDCRWNKTRAAEILGVSPKTLAAKLKIRRPRSLRKKADSSLRSE